MLRLAMMLLIGGGMLLYSVDRGRSLTVQEAYSRAGRGLEYNLCCEPVGECLLVEQFCLEFDELACGGELYTNVIDDTRKSCTGSDPGDWCNQTGEKTIDCVHQIACSWNADRELCENTGTLIHTYTWATCNGPCDE